MTTAAPHWVGIDAADYELPGAPIDVLDWAKQYPDHREQVDRIVASGSRYFHSAADIGEVELAIRAVARLVDARRFSAPDIGAVVHAHTQPYSVPAAPRSLPLEVARAFGIRPRWVGSIAQLKCVSLAAGFETLRALMAASPQLNAGLIVSVDRVYGERYRLRQLGGIQSDGAACLLVTRNSTRSRIGGVAIRNYVPRWYPGSDIAPHIVHEMAFKEWIYTRWIMLQAAESSGVAMSDYGQISPNNMDLPDWRALCHAMHIPEQRLFIDNTLRRGHVCCSNFAINLADAGFAAIDGGMHVMTVMQSNMGAFGAVTLHPASAPERTRA
jgi:hypothetical protein